MPPFAFFAAGSLFAAMEELPMISVRPDFNGGGASGPASPSASFSNARFDEVRRVMRGPSDAPSDANLESDIVVRARG